MTQKCKHERTRVLYDQRKTPKGRRFVADAKKCLTCGERWALPSKPPTAAGAWLRQRKASRKQAAPCHAACARKDGSAGRHHPLCKRAGA